MSGMSRGEAYKILREIGYIQQSEKRKRANQSKQTNTVYTHRNPNVPRYGDWNDGASILLAAIIAAIFLVFIL